MNARSGWIASICVVTAFAPVVLGAGPGEPDPAFTPPTIGGGFPNTVFAVTLQPDGKILVGGNFRFVEGADRVGLARLNADGSLDTTFAPATNVPPDVRVIVVQPDGRILVGVGNPSSSAPSVLRLEADGSRDAGFNFSPASQPRGALALVLQADGRILVGGGTPPNPAGKVSRILANGQLDGSFSFAAGGMIESMAFGLDSRLFVTGEFTYNHGFIMLSTNAVSLAFPLNVSTNFAAHAVAVQADGKVVVGGSFTNINGVPVNNIARYGTTMALDTSFRPGAGPNGVVRSIVTQADGRILVAGDFSAYADRPCAGVARLQTNGVWDASFHPAAGLGLGHPRLALQSDGAVLVAGASSTGHPLVRLLGGDAPDAVPVVSIQPAKARVTSGESVSLQVYAASGTPCTYQWLHDGTTMSTATNATLVLTNFTAALGGTYSVSVGNALGTTRSDAVVEVIALSSWVGRLDTTYNTATRAQVMDGLFALALEPGGGAILGGGFRSFNGFPSTNLVRVDAMGNVDTNFNTGAMAAGVYPDWTQVLARQSDGRVVCGGRFSRHLVRMTATGDNDTSFPYSIASLVYALAIQDDGRILYGGTSSFRRILPTGLNDVTFSGGTPSAAVRAILVQPDGRILVGGDFTTWSTLARPALVRLNPLGDVDYTFDARMVSGAKVTSLVAQPDGRIIIGGAFTSAGGATRAGVARLNPDGSVDRTFDVGSGFTTRMAIVVAALALQSDGKVFVGGGFSTAQGQARPAIVRLNPDGRLDPTFNTGSGPDGPVYAMAIQEDGDLIIAGDFNNVDHQPRDRLARLFGDHPPPLAPTLGVTVALGQSSVTFQSEPSHTYILERAEDLTAPQWSRVAAVTGDGNGLSIVDPGPLPSQRFYRLVVE